MVKDKTYGQVMQDLQGFFRSGERRKLYEACKNNRDRILIRLLWKSGRRISEILALKVSDLDFENNNILWHIEKKSRLLKDKNNQIIKDPITDKPLRQKIDLTRVKPMDKRTMAMLGAYIQEQGFSPPDLILPITRQRAFQIIREVGKISGVRFVGNKQIHPHHFRHTFAVDYAKEAQSPSDLRKLQMFLEHSSLDMTEQYLQFGNKDLRDMVDKERD